MPESASMTLVSTGAPSLEMPRGRMIDADKIVARFFTDGDGKRVVTDRWVRDNMPYKICLSHSRVFWYDVDVEAVIEQARRLGIPVKRVRLAHLEPAA